MIKNNPVSRHKDLTYCVGYLFKPYMMATRKVLDYCVMTGGVDEECLESLLLSAIKVFKRSIGA